MLVYDLVLLIITRRHLSNNTSDMARALLDHALYDIADHLYLILQHDPHKFQEQGQLFATRLPARWADGARALRAAAAMESEEPQGAQNVNGAGNRNEAQDHEEDVDNAEDEEGAEENVDGVNGTVHANGEHPQEYEDVPSDEEIS